MGDEISKLPIDTKLETSNESIDIIETIIPKNKSESDIWYYINEFKFIIITGLLYTVLSLPFIDNTVHSLVGTKMMTVGAKFIIFIILLCIVKYSL